MVDYLEELRQIIVQLRKWRMIAAIVGRQQDRELLGQSLTHLESLKTTWEDETVVAQRIKEKGAENDDI